MSKFLLLKGKAGLGNSLLSVLGGVLYSKLTARQLYIDWVPARAADRANNFPRFFARPQLVDPTLIWHSTSVAPEIWIDHLQDTVDELMPRYEADVDADCNPAISKKYTIDLARIDYTEDVLVRWAWTHELYRVRQHLQGPFASLGKLSDKEILRKIVHEELTLAPSIQGLVDEFRSREFANITIGLHIRHSDRKNSFDQYPFLIDKILRKHPGARVFLATDNQDVEALFRKCYPRLAIRGKWYAPSGTPLHRTRCCPDTFTLTVDALVEMWLLGQCQFLIYNKTSTYGVLASLISTAPTSAIFDTSPWVTRARNWGAESIKKLRLRLPSGIIH